MLDEGRDQEEERRFEEERRADRVADYTPEERYWKGIAADVAGGGCEPYSFDFGDREIREWLEKWLTATELAEHDRWLEAFPQRRYAFTFWRRLLLRPYWLVTWPWQQRRQRHLRRFSELAAERSGHGQPGPSWKVRHEFGVAAGDRDELR